MNVKGYYAITKRALDGQLEVNMDCLLNYLEQYKKDPSLYEDVVIESLRNIEEIVRATTMLQMRVKIELESIEEEDESI